MLTTLNAIREHGPCEDGWEKLLTHLGKTKADDKPLPLITILESNGLEDAIWCLRTVEGHDREIRLFAVACARRVEHLHPICKPTIDVAERYANGEATEEELKAASDAAWAAGDAAGAAAGAAAGDAPWAAARAASGAAAGAEREAQEILFRKFFGEESC